MNPPLTPNIEACPIDDKKMLTDGRTEGIPYPKAGYNCNPFGIAAQTSKKSLTQVDPKDKEQVAKDCDGVKPFATDLYKPYAYNGNCLTPPLVPNIESCPIDDKKQLTDGRTAAIPYPKPGYNCNPYGIAAQKSHVLSQC